jgi:hypothetical protein
VCKKDLPADDKQFFSGCKQLSAVQIDDCQLKKVSALLICFADFAIIAKPKNRAKRLCLFIRTN